MVEKQLIGEYTHTLDSKRRVFIPSDFRVTKDWIITTGFENSLFLFPDTEWERITLKIQNAVLTKKDTRNFLRLFLSRARNISLDSQGRILIPEPLADYSSVEKNCVFIGMLSRIEIWNPEIWKSFVDDNHESFTDLAENITGVEI